jgi:predicted DCC family thiol-disulfide oxidoreductase YuxK
LQNHPYILIFDGVCNLCNGMVQFFIKNDKQKKLRFASLQSEFGQQVLKQNGLNIDQFDTFIFIENDILYTKSDAGLKVFRTLGGIWRFMYVFILLPKFFRDWVYSLIAKNRYKLFGKQESCWIPTPELKSRFL